MYTPSSFRVEDVARVHGFIHDHGFATLMSDVDGRPFASHLPVLLDEQPEGGVLRSHMAKANEQWRSFSPDREVLCIFHGPHAYISPSWYESKDTVPTWNYAVVHAYGIPSIETDPVAVRRILDDTTSKYEKPRPNPWRMSFPEEIVARMQAAIVAFSIRITRIETKFKLGQNRSEADQRGMLQGLSATPDDSSRALADFILKQKSS